MKILIGKTFGLGNAIMSIPMIKALRSLNHQIDVLIGNTQDDCGAIDIFKHLHRDMIIDNIFFDKVDLNKQYDIAIMAIPFDGRWVESVHFSAKQVLDGRPRPIPSTTGLVSWKKHEVEYQMDDAYHLGFTGSVPSLSFLTKNDNIKQDINNVYLGVGYKKDNKRFWDIKHLGNKNYISLIKKILDFDENIKIYSTGDMMDFKVCLKNISEEVNNDRFIVNIESIDKSFQTIKKCSTYIGNDTGFMHVAASLKMHCIVPFFLENSIVKNRPYDTISTAYDMREKNENLVEQMFLAFKTRYELQNISEF